jgi:hypothetical protein
MPPGVPDAEERTWLAGKIGGRTTLEETSPSAAWAVCEVAVLSV